MDIPYGTPTRVKRHGSPTFYELLEEMANTHDTKSHDYASNTNPSGNYHFAGKMATMFSHSPEDAGFVGRLAEKIYRLANLESSNKAPRNESVADTEKDIAVITALWMADRRDRRSRAKVISEKLKQQMREGSWEGFPDYNTTEGLGQANPPLGAELSRESQGPQKR